MKKFSSIDQFKSAVHNVRAYATKNGTALPAVHYRGTVKLHGTNAGVGFTEPGGIYAQSKNNILSIGSDNAGFAAFTQKTDSQYLLEMLFFRLETITGYMADSMTIYGEWIGPGIQKGVAISELPNRQFVIYKVGIKTEGDEPEEFYRDLSWRDIAGMYFDNLYTDISIPKYNEAGIFFIDQAPVYEILVDFRCPELITPELEALTLRVEERCPWGVLHGIEGIGEGIVWGPSDPELAKHAGLWFKTKGIKHQKSNKTKSTNVVVADPVRVEALRDLVDVIVPKWRLDQGLKEINPEGRELTNRDIGAYLKWVMTDTLKEESDTIANNDFDWKTEISKAITLLARLHFAQNT